MHHHIIHTPTNETHYTQVSCTTGSLAICKNHKYRGQLVVTASYQSSHSNCCGRDPEFDVRALCRIWVVARKQITESTGPCSPLSVFSDDVCDTVADISPQMSPTTLQQETSSQRDGRGEFLDETA